ncbi:MAG: diaminopimelate epimerase [Gemmatimonadales bacterium]|nr:MAG: diaminopimelate epimerase [Gemmatimonadales bacterium]
MTVSPYLSHRPRTGPRFTRAHGLGNDYLVFEAAGPDEPGFEATPEAVQRICHRTRGVGSDGIVVLLDPDPGPGNPFPLRMFNPDGSEFERSGNGLRILAWHLLRRERVEVGQGFQVRSGGDVIQMTVHGEPRPGLLDISVEMGRASVGPEAVGFDRAPGAVGDDDVRLDLEGVGTVSPVLVSVGNPHAVVFRDRAPRGTTLPRLGRRLAVHPAFSEGTNVQLAGVDEAGRVHIEIWERGVGPTEASGTSSCAAAVAAVREGRVAPGAIPVLMEGGEMEVQVGPELDVVLRGPVQEVSGGVLAPGFLRYAREG